MAQEKDLSTEVTEEDIENGVEDEIPVKFRDNIRIKKIIIENFRAFQNVEIPFNNFNCVIGKNDVGKSTIFAALKWFFDKNAELTKEDFANSYFDSPKSGEDNQYTISVAVFFSGIYLPKTSPKYSKFIYDKDYLDKDNCICIRKYQDNVVDIALPQKKGYSIKTYPLKTKFNSIFSKLTSKQIKEVYREKFQDELFTDLDNYRNKRQICNKIYDYSVNEGIEPSWEEFNNSQLSPEPFYLDWLDSYQFQIYTGDTPISNYLNTLIIPHIYKSINKAKKKIKGELLDSLKKNNITEDLLFNLNAPITCFTDNSIYFFKDPIPIPLKYRGDGLKLMITNTLIKMLAEKKTDNNIIFAFEEPETHLHPTAQREMYQTIKKLSENPNYQVLMTTHSPYIVKELQQDNSNIIVVKRNEQENRSYISKLEERVLPYVSMNEINYIAFDESSIEYHIELFGYIHNKLMDKYDNDSSFQNDWILSIQAPNINGVPVTIGVNTIKGVDIWLEVKNGAKKYNWYETKTFTKEKRTLPYCVRNNMDHPLTEDDRSDINKHRAFVNNAKFIKYIKKSIEIMRDAIINNPLIFI